MKIEWIVERLYVYCTVECIGILFPGLTTQLNSEWSNSTEIIPTTLTVAVAKLWIFPIPEGVSRLRYRIVTKLKAPYKDTQNKQGKS
jgi:hypothetical protein